MERRIIDRININDFNYDLPEDRVAYFPVKRRDHSKLLLYDSGDITEDVFSNVYNYLPGNTFLVFNNSRVIRARFRFPKKSGAVIEVFCLEPVSPHGYDSSLNSSAPVEWLCMVGNLKRWKDECLALEFRTGAGQFRLTAEKVFPAGEASGVRFSWNAPNLTFREVMEVAGHVPLPPYIKRDDETEDNTRYQTVYSRVEGSVAAPTAGLHFTPEILDTIRSRGINTTELTLHVSAGTFQPVKANNIKKHLMHGEHFFVSKESLSGIIRNAENIIAVGTTSVRTLESLYWAGVRIIRNPSGYENDPSIGQWEPYGQNENITPRESLGALIDYMNRKGRGYLHGTTRLMIVPGYRFRLTGGLMTNFHLPKSTLLLLVSAWVGEDWKKIYNFALENKFRFLSFGDSSLLFNKE